MLSGSTKTSGVWGDEKRTNRDQVAAASALNVDAGKLRDKASAAIWRVCFPVQQFPSGE